MASLQHVFCDPVIAWRQYNCLLFVWWLQLYYLLFCDFLSIYFNGESRCFFYRGFFLWVWSIQCLFNMLCPSLGLVFFFGKNFSGFVLYHCGLDSESSCQYFFVILYIERAFSVERSNYTNTYCLFVFVTMVSVLNWNIIFRLNLSALTLFCRLKLSIWQW